MSLLNAVNRANASFKKVAKWKQPQRQKRILKYSKVFHIQGDDFVQVVKPTKFSDGWLKVENHASQCVYLIHLAKACVAFTGDDVDKRLSSVQLKDIFYRDCCALAQEWDEQRRFQAWERALAKSKSIQARHLKDEAVFDEWGDDLTQ